MKKFIFVLILCVVFSGCLLKGKKVVLTDSKTGTNLTVTEDGLIVNGTIPIGNGASITVTEEKAE